MQSLLSLKFSGINSGTNALMPLNFIFLSSEISMIKGIFPLVTSKLRNESSESTSKFPSHQHTTTLYKREYVMQPKASCMVSGLKKKKKNLHGECLNGTTVARLKNLHESPTPNHATSLQPR